MMKIVGFLVVLVVLGASAAPAPQFAVVQPAPVAFAQPVVRAVAPAVVTSHSSQVIARNFNTLAAPVYPAVRAAPVVSPFVAGPAVLPYSAGLVAAPAVPAPFF